MSLSKFTSSSQPSSLPVQAFMQVWACSDQVWSCMLQVWAYSVQAWSCILQMWACLVQVWSCMLQVWAYLQLANLMQVWCRYVHAEYRHAAHLLQTWILYDFTMIRHDYGQKVRYGRFPTYMQKFDKVLYLKNQFALTFFGLAEQEISLNKNIRACQVYHFQLAIYICIELFVFSWSIWSKQNMQKKQCLVIKTRRHYHNEAFKRQMY